MAELPASAAPSGRTVRSPSIPGLGAMAIRMRSSDMALAFIVLGIIVILILPLPAFLLDLLLAVSIILSVLILMTALFIETPLQFSAFPTVLLIATMLRLSLNLASTRLILANGHTGPGAAGHVIEAFGQFVMSGNYVIGIVVFVILLTVNFIVITKGSGRAFFFARLVHACLFMVNERLRLPRRLINFSPCSPRNFKTRIRWTRSTPINSRNSSCNFPASSNN